jgi:hypothetical protein
MSDDGVEKRRSTTMDRNESKYFVAEISCDGVHRFAQLSAEIESVVLLHWKVREQPAAPPLRPSLER